MTWIRILNQSDDKVTTCHHYDDGEKGATGAACNLLHRVQVGVRQKKRPREMRGRDDCRTRSALLLRRSGLELHVVCEVHVGGLLNGDHHLGVGRVAHVGHVLAGADPVVGSAVIEIVILVPEPEESPASP